MNRTSFAAGAVLAVAMLSTGLVDCASRAKDVACENDDECQARGGGFKYCLDSRCVRCGDATDCPEGLDCMEGDCQ